ncbi:hypothetical protein OGATHE_005565 [Ogataea polymorpha]|uniref:Uncharacterized protein n=1 Tax=Ogataea polymorpha TaxID=460523 RepID=A0A9P8NTM4_9ASCO|nr:hypothetical protein OGATHE_005565 [Ogataea polymorpha]
MSAHLPALDGTDSPNGPQTNATASPEAAGLAGTVQSDPAAPSCHVGQPSGPHKACCQAANRFPAEAGPQASRSGRLPCIYNVFILHEYLRAQP